MKLFTHQLRNEQLIFWRSREAAFSMESQVIDTAYCAFADSASANARR